MAMTSGAASGAWVIPEPHAEQKVRWTSRPEPPLLTKLVVGPLMLTLSLGKMTERAKTGVRIETKHNQPGGGPTVGRTSVALAVVAVVIDNRVRLLSVDAVSNSLTEAVTGNSHLLRVVIGLVKRFGLD